MEITEVRIKLMEDSDDRLQAFCSITFDDAFVVRDLKIIGGTSGPFVAMPSRKLTAHCPQCGCKNHLRASFCNQCGLRLNSDRAPRDAEGRAKLYADIAHPINSACREMIQNRVISEFRNELDRAKQPGYVSRYDDDYEDAGPEDLRESGLPPKQRVDEAAHGQPTPHTQHAPQPQQREQHGPHKPPSRTETPAPQKPPKPKGNFGEGIL
jgi:stage V sporulation protein G